MSWLNLTIPKRSYPVITDTAQTIRHTHRHPRGRRTLTLIRDGRRLLLGQKKRGFGAGRWNGFGGKVHPRETIQAAALREVEEECGLRLPGITQRGQIFFTFAHNPLQLEMHIFAADSFIGTPRETEEMKPRWFDTLKLPYQQMWADDRLWLPLFLHGRLFTGHVHFADWETIAEHHLKEVAPGSEPWHIASVT